MCDRYAIEGVSGLCVVRWSVAPYPYTYNFNISRLPGVSAKGKVLAALR
jgi:hypothetical protein